MWEKFKKSLALNILFFALVAFVGYGTFNMVRQTASLFEESGDTERKIEELTKKKLELEAYIAELETPQAIEREAKSRLNLKLPGEEVVVVVGEEKEGEKKAEGFFDRLKSFFR